MFEHINLAEISFEHIKTMIGIIFFGVLSTLNFTSFILPPLKLYNPEILCPTSPLKVIVSKTCNNCNVSCEVNGYMSCPKTNMTVKAYVYNISYGNAMFTRVDIEVNLTDGFYKICPHTFLDHEKQ